MSYGNHAASIYFYASLDEESVFLTENRRLTQAYIFKKKETEVVSRLL